MFFFNASFFKKGWGINNSLREGSKLNERRINSNLNERFSYHPRFLINISYSSNQKNLGRGSAYASAM